VGLPEIAPLAHHIGVGPSAFDGLFRRIGNWFKVLLPE
jgi:hypothetical protein